MAKKKITKVNDDNVLENELTAEPIATQSEKPKSKTAKWKT